MKNRIAVITGGTKGIGLALVEKFLSEGFEVFTTARNSSVELNNSKLHFLSADLSIKEGVDKFAKFVLTNTQTIDVLINNTGVFIPGQIHTEQEGNLELQMNTNLYSAYHLTRKILPIMMNNKQGQIFNICSIASITPYSSGGSYSISKYAMYGMTKCLREEMKPHGIKVTAVLPGAVFTSSWDGVDVDENRLMPANDIAHAIFETFNLSERTVVEDLILRPFLGDL